MKTTVEFLAFGTLALLITLVCIPIIKKIAVRVNLVDMPDFRKVHSTPVPLVGGIAIAFSFTLVILLTGNRLDFLMEYLPILTCGFVLLSVGVIDDKIDVSAKYKLAIQFVLSVVIAFSGTRISSLNGLFGIYEIVDWVQYVLTIVVIIGVVNAFNLMDGVDGLVGGLGVLGFTMFLLASIYFGDYFLGKISVIFIGAIAGFLRFNLSKKKIFMGDAGSLLIGFLLITLGIKFMEEQASSQNGYAYGFLLLVSFFSVPVLDSLRVYLSRIKQGDSPFKADKTHLHHLLLTAGLTHKKVAIAVISFSMILFFLGFGLLSYKSVSIIIIFIMGVFWVIVYLLLMINNLHKWKSKLKILEQK